MPLLVCHWFLWLMVLSWRKLAPPLGYSGALANDMQAPLGSSELTFAACAPCKCFPMIIVHSFCRALEETSVVPCSLQKPHPWSVLDLPECNLNAVRLRVTSLDALHSIWHYVSCWTLCRNDDTVFFFWCPLPMGTMACCPLMIQHGIFLQARPLLILLTRYPSGPCNRSVQIGDITRF